MEISDEEPSDSQKTPEEQIREIALQKPATKWGTELAILCYIFSVSLDPLLLYSLILSDDRKCVAVDTKLEKIAIVLRSLADLSYVGRSIRDMHTIAMQLRVIKQEEAMGRSGQEDDSTCICISKTIGILVRLIVNCPRALSLTMAILAALPVPQIAIFVFFPKLSASRALKRMRIMNLLILLQYLPRIYPIYKYCKNLNDKYSENLYKETTHNQVSDNCNNSDLGRKRWVPGLLNFIIYILASHVFGAFWYFFSIQRQIECWGCACQSGNGCEFRIFDCDDGTPRNVTLLNDLCPINPSNAKVFDFGIYLDALQSGMLGSTDFPRKILQCFSWGVRNLSSFGSNLKTSMNAWETLFVVFISISGLLLFIYLLGNLQIFMQATNKDWIRLKMRKIDSEVQKMSNEYGFSINSYHIWLIVQRQLRRDDDLAMENIFSILPFDVQEIIKRQLLLPKLKEVPMLQDIHRNVLDAILKDLKQVMYDGGNCIIREGEPLDMMIFISRGSVLTYNTSTGHGGGRSGLSNTIGRLTGGDFYGQELISWATTSTSFSDLPISNKTLKSHKQVEVFAIRASDLLRIVSEHKKHFKTEAQRPHQTDIALIEINEHGNS